MFNHKTDVAIISGNNYPIAIILGGGGYNDMGLIRSCGEAYMDVIMVVSDKSVVPIHKSKYIVGRYRIDILDRTTVLEIVKDIRKSNADRPIVIFPASDIAACIIDSLYDQLEEHIIVPNACGNLNTLMDKQGMVETALKCGIPTPYSEKYDLRVIPYPNFSTPCIIKPLRSIKGEKGDITICRDKNIYQQTLDKYQKKGFYEVIIQELIDGNNQKEIAVTGVSLGDGNIVMPGIIYKKRIRGNGSTVFGLYSINNDKLLTDYVSSFITQTGFKGIFDMEFLHNKSGYYFIECNFRNGAYGYAVTKAGFNMPNYFYNGVSGKILPELKLRNIKFMEERTDFLNVLDHSISPIKWIKDVLQTDTFLWWNWKDPKPMLRIPAFIKKKFSRKSTTITPP